jgi:DNA primase
MVIYPESNTFHCYSCGENGNVLWFISKMEHKPLFEVKKQYAGTVTKYKIGKIRNCGINDYKDDLLTQIAKITRKFLGENPAKLSQVLCVLSDIDAKVFKQEKLDRNVKIELLDTLMLHLKNIKEDTSVC